MKALVFHMVKDNEQYSFYVTNRDRVTDTVAKNVIDKVSRKFNHKYDYDNIPYVKSMMYKCDVSINKIDGDYIFKDNGSTNFTSAMNSVEVTI